MPRHFSAASLIDINDHNLRSTSGQDGHRDILILRHYLGVLLDHPNPVTEGTAVFVVNRESEDEREETYREIIKLERFTILEMLLPDGTRADTTKRAWGASNSLLNSGYVLGEKTDKVIQSCMTPHVQSVFWEGRFGALQLWLNRQKILLSCWLIQFTCLYVTLRPS